MRFPTGHELGRELARALNLPAHGWQRIVVVADVNEMPQIYVKGIPAGAAVPGIVTAVENVFVTDDGAVHVAAAGPGGVA